MLYLTCTTITSIDLAHYGVCRAKDWVSVKCGTTRNKCIFIYVCAKLDLITGILLRSSSGIGLRNLNSESVSLHEHSIRVSFVCSFILF